MGGCVHSASLSKLGECRHDICPSKIKSQYMSLTKIYLFLVLFAEPSDTNANYTPHITGQASSGHSPLSTPHPSGIAQQ